MEYINKRLYNEESKGLDISTRWPARCHVTYHVHVAELIDPRYEWSILSGCPNFQTLPSQLLIGSKKLADGKS